tara:strand:- start:3591 stop:3737 length:147 start_codon:yes stop_codon:yes gene_type:complete
MPGPETNENLIGLSFPFVDLLRAINNHSAQKEIRAIESTALGKPFSKS